MSWNKYTTADRALHHVNQTYTNWTDLRVPVTSTQAVGSRAPVYRKFVSQSAVTSGYAIQTGDTDGQVTVSHGTSFALQGDWTMSLWVIFPETAGTKVFITKPGRFEFQHRFSGIMRFTGFNGANINYPITENARTHLVITQEDIGSSYETKLYVNGVQVGSSIHTTQATSISDLVIGNASWAGTIDTLAFFSEAYQQADVDTLYANGNGVALVGDEANLLVGYNFDEGTGTVADNIEGTAAYDGVVGTGVTWVSGMVTTTSSQGVILPSFSSTIEQELYFTVQMPHEWKLGTNIKPHIHWCPNETDTGNVSWGLEYSWASFGEVYPTSTIIYANEIEGVDTTLVANKHYITDLGEIDATDKGLSSMLVCRVFRDATSSGETDDYAHGASMLEIDFHYQVDSLGSQEEYIKRTNSQVYVGGGSVSLAGTASYEYADLPEAEFVIGSYGDVTGGGTNTAGYSIYDGTSWTDDEQVTGEGVGRTITEDLVGFIGGVAFVIVEDEATGSNKQAYSFDGSTWTTEAATITSYRGCKDFVARLNSGVVEITTDGSNWTVPTTGPGTSISRVACSSSTFYSYDGTNIYSSIDSGDNWTVLANQPSSFDEAGNMVATSSGLFTIASDGTAEYTLDGGATAWQSSALAVGITPTIVSATSDGTKIMVSAWEVGAGNYLGISTDNGATFTTLTAPGSGISPFKVFAPKAGTWFLTLADGATFASSSSISVDDGANWTAPELRSSFTIFTIFGGLN